ncbi:hypothetical protein H6P81_000517 [Aristolochia fimbriata]|uniref:non-specific serine/threonine protein kinase n=1 Tax=Aristolochia fimbriata TaxID=158543 RepID=A0AAV7F5V3_ARIFI|nr:hypothetical protein H6P81_000517 [Aristolochia fimbriata]
MGYGGNVGKYQLGRTIGEGTFAKVKLGLDSQTGQSVAIKIIDKRMVVHNKLMDQVKAEITTMKLLRHPNIVRIYEVIATKTKIFMIMEYVSGGQLSDKMSYTKRLSEAEARRYFQQLIDAVEYCHGRGVFHRDLKPENLLLDSQGNLKVSDFGLSTARKPRDLLSTACGSPTYVAPEVIANRSYYGSPVDVWSCGVILFELLAGFLPFDDRNLLNLYRKISRADYTFPLWFNPSQKKLISRILDPLPRTRMTIAEILEDEWFQIDYKPSTGFDNDDCLSLDDVNAAFGSIRESTDEMEKPKSPNFINAFQLIAMSNDLDLSGLFEEQIDRKRTRLGSEHSIQETIEKIKAAAKDARLSVERMNNSKVKLQEITKLRRCQSLAVSAEVIEVTPSHCVVEISKSAGELRLYKEFCRSLSNVLTERSSSSSMVETPPEEGKVEKEEDPQPEL